MDLLLKEVKQNGQQVQAFSLFHYRHFWMSADLVAVQMSKGWEVFEVLKWDELADTPTLLVKHVGRLTSLPVEVLG